MFIKAFPSGPFLTNCYVVTCPETNKAAVIDPSPESSKAVSAYLQEQNFVLAKILLTHSHWDHIADVSILKKIHPAPVYIHTLDVPNLERPGSDKLPCWIDIEGVTPDVLFTDGDHVAVGNIDFSIIHTPGHTPGGICFFCEAELILFSGDTLFKGSIGNISFPTSLPEAMWTSLDKLALLPPSTKVYPGHGPSTTIRAENWLPNARTVFG